MERIKKWSRDPGTGLILVAIAILALFVFGVVGFIKEGEAIEKAEAYRHQLIAVCGAIDDAVSNGYVIKDINIGETHHKGAVEDFIELVGYAKKADGREDGASYAIFPGGEIELIHLKDEPYQKLSWKDFPKFIQIFKR